MTSGGNYFNYFPENELTKFKLCPPTSLFFLPLPKISVTHFASPGVPLEATDHNCMAGLRHEKYLAHALNSSHAYAVIVHVLWRNNNVTALAYWLERPLAKENGTGSYIT